MKLSKKVTAAAAVGAGAVLAKKMKSKQFCPICTAKSLLAKTQVHAASGEEKYNNGVALTPPMGWSSWNTFRNTIDENLIKEVAVAIKETGLLDAGYRYINLDDCWQSSMRTADGKLQGDLIRFPRGIKPLVEELNEMGFKVGLYTSNGTLTCEDLPASLYHEATDADTLAEWGVEYFKYDFCHNVGIPSMAPALVKICVGTPEGSDFIEIEAAHGTLQGSARVYADERVTCGYSVAGLSSGNGSLLFDTIDAPEDGDYVLTIVFRKGGIKQKFLVCEVNGTDAHDCYFPSGNGFTAEGRLQVNIHLNKGLNTLKFYNPIGSRMDSSARQYTNMGRELKRATREYAEKNGVEEKPICYSICEWGFNRPWKWGAKAGNLWRTTMDIKPFWASLMYNYGVNVMLYRHAGPGGWNDPDMLEVGVDGLTMEENKTHFSLWCMMASPLIMGNDVRQFLNEDGTVKEDDKVLAILKNKELIAIDQDERGLQAKRVYTDVITDVLAKPLANRELALCFLNKGGQPKKMSYKLERLHNEPQIDLPLVGAYSVTDVWDGTELTLSDTVDAVVPPHGVKVFRIKAAE